MQLLGRSIIGSRRGADHGAALSGLNPATGERLEPAYSPASLDEVNEAAELAHDAFASYSQVSGSDKAAFLRAIAREIEAIGDPLVARATAETGLPAARIQGETARTCFQLRLFAELVEEGSWIDARIDLPDPARQPLPKADLRSMQRPLGPVVVFCASNFPLAFSVAGGDTASALAGGNPVIVKAHHAHPGTAELVGIAVEKAARECQLPEGVFSLLYGSGNEIGTALMTHPHIKAGGFTGSRSGGQALMRVAAARPEPIPFYAEMSSINPVVILPGALTDRLDQIAVGLHASVTLGAGQFCTNPGLVLLEEGASTAPFIERFAGLMSGSAPFTMLTPGISDAYRRGVASHAGSESVSTIVRQEGPTSSGGCQAGTALFQTDAASFLANAALSDEIFGPATLFVTHSNREQLLQIVRSLEGHLTATVLGSDEDLVENRDLIAILETRVGRLVFNGFPTGVEVCHSMVHGGPYPATSDGRSTSVGTRAIYRFTRAVCYQSFPQSSLPMELRNSNPLGILRMVDGQFTRESLSSGN
ncbi:MAG: aldehyde dehydrogenase (NADP(+)) [Acidobacteriota bacterium]